jgi:hypothetical protein
MPTALLVILTGRNTIIPSLEKVTRYERTLSHFA